MGEGVNTGSPLEADGAFKFVLPRLPDEAYIFPPPEAGADEEFDVYG